MILKDSHLGFIFIESNMHVEDLWKDVILFLHVIIASFCSILIALPETRSLVPYGPPFDSE